MEEITLKDIVNNETTDKNTQHTYLDLYQRLLSKKSETAKNVLEIGIGAGGSIKMWHDFFPNAHIYGVDILFGHELSEVDPLLNEGKRFLSFMERWNPITSLERVTLNLGKNAYDDEFFENTFLKPGIKFDLILDDGDHRLPSMLTFIQQYSQLLTEDGILMIEDVQSWDWIESMVKSVPEHLQKYVQTYDLRQNKGQYDDIVFTIDKLNYKD